MKKYVYITPATEIILIEGNILMVLGDSNDKGIPGQSAPARQTPAF